MEDPCAQPVDGPASAPRTVWDRLGLLSGSEGVFTGTVVCAAAIAYGAGRNNQRRRGGRSRAFAAGLLAGREDARLDAILRNAADAYGELTSVRPFWR